MSRFRILHFATHVVLESGNGLRSWLVLSEVAKEKRANKPKKSQPDGQKVDLRVNTGEDGRLEAREVMVMRLTSEMTVLSACNSALGERHGGEGLQGLAWGFQAAGCPSIVASLWKIDDRATRELMVAFYQNLRMGKRKDDSLRVAMQHIRQRYQGRAFAHPAFWAGFQVIGDTSSLYPTRMPRGRMVLHPRGEANTIR